MPTTLIDWILHLDVHLASLASLHGSWIYLVLFVVIFAETGLVIMPFLPGDSLLFVAGAMSADSMLNLPELAGILMMAAIAGDAVNYGIGAYVRRQAISTNRIPFLKSAHLDRTQNFFARHGSKTIVLARFVPIVRTLAPFVAALGNMPYRKFIIFNVVGAVTWVVLLVGAGFAFGNIPWIKNNLTVVILAIVFLSLLPGLIGWASTKINSGRANK
jgi:membrane-associated protein